MLSKKQTHFLVAVATVLFSLSSHAYEDSGISYPARIAGKFGIGMINATTGIVEIPKTMMVMSENEGLGMGLSVGFLKGMGNMMGRTFLGVIDVISFPIPTKPLINPPVVFQDFDVGTTYGDGWETY